MRKEETTAETSIDLVKENEQYKSLIKDFTNKLSLLKEKETKFVKVFAKLKRKGIDIEELINSKKKNLPKKVEKYSNVLCEAD